MTLTLTYADAGRRAARNAFGSAHAQATFQAFVNRLLGRPTHLLSFDVARKALGATVSGPKLRRDICLVKIVGSVGRTCDYSPDFMPLRRYDEERWAGVKQATGSANGLPPIDVFKIGEGYFVLDGHHRVSVLKQLRAAQVEAFVTEVRPLEPCAVARLGAGTPVRTLKASMCPKLPVVAFA